MIQDEETVKATLHHSLSQSRKQLHEKELLKQKLWEESRHTFSSAMPPLAYKSSISFVTSRAPSPSLFMLDVQTMEDCKKEAEHYLVTRLDNVERI